MTKSRRPSALRSVAIPLPDEASPLQWTDVDGQHRAWDADPEADELIPHGEDDEAPQR